MTTTVAIRGPGGAETVRHPRIGPRVGEWDHHMWMMMMIIQFVQQALMQEQDEIVADPPSRDRELIESVATWDAP